MTETPLRSLAKAVTWRLLGVVLTTVAVWAFTGRPALAVGIGLLELLGKLAVYYVHERVWSRIPFGVCRTEAPDSK